MTFSISGKNVLRFPFSGSRLHTVSRRIATKSESNVQRRTTPTKKPSSKALLIRVAPATARKIETLAAQQDRSLAAQTRVLIDLGLNALQARSEEHTSELQSLMRISYAVFCLKKKISKRTIMPSSKSNTT